MIGRYWVPLPKIWRSWEKENRSTPQRYLTFQDCIAKGLHNLRELIFVLHDWSNGGTFAPSEIDPGPLEQSRLEVVSMFEEARLENPNIKIPEIIIIRHDDPRAPTEFHVTPEEADDCRKKWAGIQPYLILQ
ncbi:hypothetical protein GLAREA_08504 [Glarea lozoyensis ATCC 20868]|uniref:Uncharacterized protein n=1 Tax=Glarea lozoyensis (strain ATCC 20868 / MF5171) TaxID=1116229 RepID=S3CXT8_GLAL2|nr:uncharacterized protein GLAREA_08504 [Glarea lozoyensis ATCC 20868]EPE24651.1 hypothetical protein GLAREA_08504 [Glarea lozoyensis ATCC 20868]